MFYTQMTGLLTGIVIEGLARLGLTMYDPSRSLEFYWSQVQYCAEPEPEPEEEEEEPETDEVESGQDTFFQSK